MTEPTDAELLAEWDRVSHIADAGQRRLACLRAVLAKWGTPPAVAGEPVAWLVCTEEGDPDMVFLDRLEACQYCEDDDPPKPLYLAAPPAAPLALPMVQGSGARMGDAVATGGGPLPWR